MALDAEPALVNLPRPERALDARVSGARSLRDVTLQCCFIQGSVCNLGEASLSPWIDAVSEIRPRVVQIYTINRPAAMAGVRAVPRHRLEEIAGALRARTGIDAQVFS